MNTNGTRSGPRRVRLGVAGITGYARSITNAILIQGSDCLELVAIGCPAPQERSQRAEELRQRGVKVFSDFEEVLRREDIDAVWLPLPIDMHLPFTERSLAAGKAVMCEKPAAATVEECDRMIALRDASGLPVLIGYNTIYDPAVLKMKRLLLDGALGVPLRASVIACASRATSYFERSAWAGRISIDGRWVLDSPAQNAHSHWLNLALFLLGDREDRSASVETVESELYRVNPIDNYDTCAMRVRLGAPAATSLHVYMTHACERSQQPMIEIVGTEGSLQWTLDKGGRVVGGRCGVQTLPAAPDGYSPMLTGLAKAVRGEANPNAAVATLEIARAPLVVTNAASEAAVVVDVPPSAVATRSEEGGDTLRFIPGITEVFARCAAEGQMLHESGLVDWSVPAASLSTTGYRAFRGPATRSEPAPHQA